CAAVRARGMALRWENDRPQYRRSMLGGQVGRDEFAEAAGATSTGETKCQYLRLAERQRRAKRSRVNGLPKISKCFRRRCGASESCLARSRKRARSSRCPACGAPKFRRKTLQSFI